MASLIGRRGIATRADLAAHLGVSRAHVTQTLSPLDAPDAVRAALEACEERGVVVGTAMWRRVRAMRTADAVAWLAGIGVATLTRR